jgi:hypothetical protein
VTSIADQPLSRLVLLGARSVFFCPPLDVAELRGPAAGSRATAPCALGESGWTQKFRHQAAHGGEIAVICVSESMVKDVALTVPNRTALVPVKFLPVMTTVVPPAAGPWSGSRLAMNGPGQLLGGSNTFTRGPQGGTHFSSTEPG